MRPCESTLAWSTDTLDLLALEALPEEALSGGATGWDEEFDDFFRGANPLSLTARTTLELEPEVRVHDLLLS